MCEEVVKKAALKTAFLSLSGVIVLMAEVAVTGKDHGQTTFICGLYDLFIADRPAGLDNSRNPGIGGGD